MPPAVVAAVVVDPAAIVTDAAAALCANGRAANWAGLTAPAMGAVGEDAGLPSTLRPTTRLTIGLAVSHLVQAIASAVLPVLHLLHIQGRLGFLTCTGCVDCAFLLPEAAAEVLPPRVEAAARFPPR